MVPVLFTLLALAFLTGFVRFIRRPLRTGDVQLWAAAYGLTLTADNWPIVVGYLARSQRWRRTGVLLGYFVLPFALSELGIELEAPLMLPVLAYSGGMVLAAATMPRPPVVGAAELAPRTVGQYLPARLRWIPRVFALVLVVGSAWSVTLDEPPHRHWIDSGTIVAYVVVGLILVVAGEAVERAVAGRRQPAGPADLLAADDAIRAQSAHAIAGAVIAGQASLLMPAFARPAGLNLVNPWFDLVAYLGPMVGLLVGLWYTGRAWPMRRPWSPSVPAVPAVSDRRLAAPTS